jgi:hypothetical protein
MWQLEVACELLLTECRLVTAGVLSKKGSFQIGAVLWVGMFLRGLGKERNWIRERHSRESKYIQGVFEISAQILISSYWLHGEFGKKYLKNSVKK